MTLSFDLIVIGGGINGAAVARDAAGRGLKVMLAERGDYACGVSSASSGLIHGGLRYLELYDFGLVRESLKERTLLLKTAPHLVRELRFLLPVTRDQPRRAWLIRSGLFLYDWFARSGGLPRSGRLTDAEADPLPRLRRDDISAILHYHDAQADDARLVLANLLDARSHGADIMNRRAVTGIIPVEDGYRVALDERGGARAIDARFVVNAAGPWADRVDALCPSSPPRRPVRLVRGSHIVLPMPVPVATDAYTLQNGDGRVVFVLPWLDTRFLVIGTTDVPHEGDPGGAVCTAPERDYLLGVYNRRFAHPGGAASPNDIVYSWSGVRALVDDGAAHASRVTREAQISARAQGAGGMVTLYGGKLTTHRVLAEQTMDTLSRLSVSIGSPWTARSRLFGGALDRVALVDLADQGPAQLSSTTRRRLVFTYGDVAETLFRRMAERPDLAREIAPGVPEIELLHAREAEDAMTADDFLYRRTKLALLLDDAGRQSIAGWFGGP